MLKTISEAVLFLAKQELPFRGHDESTGILNKGKYRELLRCYTKFDLGFERCLDRKVEQSERSGGVFTGVFTVQLLSAVVEGKCQKYSCIGPLTMVRMNTSDEMTLSNIKIAYKEHFGMNDHMDCDILAVERGLSYDDIGQINDFECLHMRFTEKK